LKIQISKILLIPLFICFILEAVLPSFAFASSNAGITYQGRILDPNGAVINDNNVQFRVQIRTPDSSNCLMYEEIQNVDMSTGDGSFALTINDGTGTRVDLSGYGLDQIFANKGTFTFASATCASGTTYSPNVNDGRKLQVYFKLTGAAAWEPIPAQNLNYIPQAIEAQQVGGYKPGDLLRVDKTPSQIVAALTYTDYTNLAALLAGTSTQYLATSSTQGAELPSYASNPGTPSSGSLWYDSTLKQVKYFDGSTIKTFGVASGAAGTVTSVVTGTGLTGGPITASGTISIANGGVDTPQIASSAITDPKIASGTITGDKFDPALNISTTGNVTAAQVSTTSTSARSLLLYDPDAPGINKITLSANAAIAADYAITFPATAPSAGQYLTSDAVGNLSWTYTAATTFANGSVGAPSVTFTNDLTTGLFRPASSTMSATSGGVESLRMNTVPGGINYIAVTPAAASLAPVVSAAGADTNIDLKLSPKGTGKVVTGNDLSVTSGTSSTTSSTGAVVVTGGVGVGGALNVAGVINAASVINVAGDADISGAANVTGAVTSGSTVTAAGNITTGGSVIGAVGLASAPTYTFTGNTNTGVYRPSINTVGISAGGVDGVRVNTAAGAVNYLSLTPSATSQPVIIGSAGSDAKINLQLTPKGGGNTIISSGYVGIGSASPMTILDIAGTLRVGDGGETCAGGNYTGAIRYSGSVIQFCNGVSWTTLTSSGGSGVFAAGTVGAPGWAVSGNTNTGLFSPASNTLSVAAGGVEGLRVNTNGGAVDYMSITPGGVSTTTLGTAGADANIDLTIAPKGIGNTIFSSGNVGIGMSPASFLGPGGLSVAGGGNIAGGLYVGGTGVILNGGAGEGLIWAGGPSIINDTATSTQLIFKTGSPAVEKLRIDNNGNVGIGTATPQARLHLPAGGPSASSAPLMFTTGTLLASPASGAIEYDGTNLYYTDGTNTRRTLASSGGSGTFAAGSAAAPGWSVTGNVNTGLFSPASNTISLSAGGIEGLRVNTASGATDYIALTPGGVSSTQISTAGTDVNVDLKLAPKGAGNTIVSTGSVGIGTTAPGSTLDVNGTIQAEHSAGGASYEMLALSNTAGFSTGTGAALLFENGGTKQAEVGSAGGATSAEADMLFTTRGLGGYLEKMRILANGYVGIGTAAPNAKLDVNGKFIIEASTPGSGYAGFAAPASMATSTIWTLPAADGASGTTLSTNGAGILSWATAAAAPTTFLPGSAAAPGWAVSGNTNTGLFQAASNTLSISAGGVEALRTTYVAGAINYASIAAGAASSPVIYGAGGSDTNIGITINTKGTGNVLIPNGNVGIGVSPNINYALDVNGRIRGAAANSGGTTYPLQITNINSTATAGVGVGISFADGSTSTGLLSSTWDQNNSSYGNLIFATLTTGSTTEKMRINGYGNVGIGTTNPQARLQLPAGGPSVASAPLMFTTGTLLTSPASGAIEYDGTNLYYTDGTNTRRTIASTGGSGTFAAGSAAAPGWSVTGNTNTGLFSPASNTISLSAGGIEGLRVNTASGATDYIALTPGGVSSTQISTAGTDANIDLKIAPKGSGSTVFSSGNVGIGMVPSVNFLLDVAGRGRLNAPNSGGVTYPIVLTNSSGSSTAGVGTGISFGDGSNDSARIYSTWEQNNNNFGNLIFTTPTSAGAGPQERLRVTSAGYVGIGTTAPAARLDVNGKFILEASTPGSGYAGFAAPASMATSTIWTLPTADGASNTVLSTNGTGVLSWFTIPTASSQSTFLPGTTAAPGWAVSGNTNTGLFSPASNAISIATGGVEALRTTYVASAVNYASISGSATGTSVLYGVGGSDANVNLQLLPKGSGDVQVGGFRNLSIPSGSSIYWGTNVNIIGSFSSNWLRFTTDGNPDIFVNASGSVGIGTNTPSAKLQIAAGIAAASGAPLKFTSGTNLTTPEPGAVEYDGNFLYITNASGTRNSIATSATAATSFLSGSAAAPGWSVTGNTNTGLFSPASNTISLSAGGIEGLRVNTASGATDYVAITPGGVSSTQISTAGTDASIDIKLAPKGSGNVVVASGNLGIGNAAPVYPLDIVGNNAILGSLRTTNTIKTFDLFGAPYGVAAPIVMMSITNKSIANYLDIGGGGANAGVVNSATEIGFWTATSSNTPVSSVERMVINTNGLVGIGTTTPNARLDVNGKFILEASTPGSGYAGFAAPASMATSTIWTLPAADGASGTLLSTNGTGILSWATAAAAPTTFLPGSAAAPGWAVSGNTNTGLFSAASNSLSIATGGIEALRATYVASAINYASIAPGAASAPVVYGVGGSDTNINIVLVPKGTGSVGIGVNPPSFLTTGSLDVAGALYTGSGISSGNSVTINGGSNNGFNWADGLTAMIKDSTGSILRFQTNNTDRLRIDVNGNVGIGTTNPQARFHLPAGGTSVASAPLMFTSGSLLASPASGAVEYDGNFLYVTDSTNTRRTIATTGGSGTFNAGTAAAPGWSVAGNTNTGLFSAASNTLSFATGGFEGFRVNVASGSDYITVTPGGASSTILGVAGTDASVDLELAPKGFGNVTIPSRHVGIGTTAPNLYYQADIEGNCNGSGCGLIVYNSSAGGLGTSEIDVGNPSAPYGGLGFSGPGWTGTAGLTGVPSLGGYVFGPSTGGFSILASNAAGSVKFFTGGGTAANERMRIDQTGNVGIGTTTPQAHLHLPAGVSTPSNAPLMFTSGSLLASPASGAVEYDGNYLYITNASGTRQTVSTSATSAPTSFNAGTAAAPGWAVAGNATNGLFQAASNTLSIATGGFEGLRINQASGSDYISITPGGASTTTINAVGSDTNVDLKLVPKGGGSLVVSSGTGIERVTPGWFAGAGTWIDLDTSGPSGIGTGGAGQNAWVAYSSGAGQWFTSTAVGDVNYRNASGKRINIGIDNGSGTANPSMTFSGTSVGIGSMSPRTTLDVAGPIAGKPSVVNASTTIDFSTGNIQHTAAACGANTLINMKDGASYTFIVKSNTVGTCSFTAYNDSGTAPGLLTVHMPPGHGATTINKHTLYSMMVSGTDLYISWIPGY
jgi:hypothetical protein